MKQRKFSSHLKKQDCQLIREGGKHSWWGNRETRARSAVPRHIEISDILCREFARTWGLLSHKSWAISLIPARIAGTDQTDTRRWTVSGYFLTRLINRAAWALGRARPCSQLSRVRTRVRKYAANTARDRFSSLRRRINSSGVISGGAKYLPRQDEVTTHIKDISSEVCSECFLGLFIISFFKFKTFHLTAGKSAALGSPIRSKFGSPA